MPALILDGRKISADIRAELKAETTRLKERGIVPALAGILVGEDPASASYIGLKTKACEETGVREAMEHLPQTVTERELLKAIDKLNQDPKVHAIFIQLPMPKHL